MRAAILYWNFLDRRGRELGVGGVETYLWQLTKVCAGLGFEPVIFQSADEPFVRTIDHVMVHGVVTPRKQTPRCLLATAEREISNTDLLIFGADHCSWPSRHTRCISIQHGVFWDLQPQFLTPHKWRHSGVGRWAWKQYHSRRVRELFNNCRNRVCVDYNFLNWYRATWSSEPNGRVWVIPNFTVQTTRATRIDTHPRPVKVLFARRFVEYRGTKLIAAVAVRLLERHSNVQFTFAGEGPDEGWMRSLFANEPRVVFTKYHPEQAPFIHTGHDIAVVPSLASEGTSLAVAEALGAGCAVVASGVGGITNMIIHRHNGLLVQPNEDDVSAALEELIEHPALRHQLGTEALRTAANAFSINKWEASWKQVINTVLETP